MLDIVGLLMLAIWFACVAMLVREGLWSNTLTLINVITAAIVATGTFMALAGWLEDQSEYAERLMFYVHFLSIWIIFGITYSVLRAITDSISKVQVRFKYPVNVGGGVLAAMAVGWVVVAFTLTSLHAAPLGAIAFYKSFMESRDQRMVWGLAPDRKWLSFTYHMTSGPLSPISPDDSGDDGERTFPIPEEFVQHYRNFRGAFQGERGNLRSGTPSRRSEKRR